MEIESTLMELEETIESAVRAEVDGAMRGKMADVIRAAAHRAGESIDHHEVDRGVDFVARYVRAVPMLLREALAASHGTFAEDKMTRMVAAAAAYWDAEDDVIHDDQGLLGILDDAYCTVSLLLALSTRFHEETGQHLIGDDLERPTEVVRNLLGVPIAAKLDDYVDTALADASVDELVASLKEQPLRPPPANSSWAPEEDDAILRMFGVV